MSEIRTNILISGESSEYRSNIEISVVTLDSALVDTHSSFRTNLDITTTLKDGSISAIKTNLELNNVALKFNLVDMTKLKQSLLYFSKFFNMYFEPEVMWDLLAQGTNEQINISHLNEALSNYVKIDTTNNILTDLERVKLNLQKHIKDNKKHLTEKEKEFLLNLMENPNSFGSGDSLFEKVSINQNNIILPAVKPLKQDGKDAGIISNTFISCRGIDSTASSGSGGITRIDLFNILSDEPISDSEFINNKFLKISPLIEDWIRHHLKEFETDPTVPDFIKKITEEQIKSWDAVASWFDISEDKSYIFTTNERGFVSHSFISCKGLDLNAASSGGSFSRSELFDILSENPQEGERINLKYLIGLEELVESFGFLKDINKNQVITALGYTPLKKEDFKDFATVSNIVKQDVDNWNFVFSLIGLSEDESYIFPKENRGFASDSFISCKGLDISANQIGGGISEDDFSTLLFNILTGNPTEGQFINLAFLDLSSYAQKDWINLTYATKTSLEEKASKVITFDAGDGIIGGGTLESNRTFTLGIPSKITSITTNAVTSESHTHEIDQASTSVVGIVKLYDALDSDSTILALTAKQGKAIGTRVVALEDMWENKTTHLLAKNNRGIVSNSFISCKELDETAPQVGNTFDRNSLFEILSNEPQNGESINLGFLDLSNYVTIDYISSQDYITSNALSGYATQQWVINKNYALTSDLTALRTDFDNLSDVLNGNVGGVIDTWNEVVSFLDGYSQSDDLASILSGMNSDIANRVLIEDFEKLEEAIDPLFGYFDASGSANNALKLGGQLPSYYASQSSLDTTNANVTSLTQKLSTIESGVATNKTNIATLTTNLSDLTGRVDIAEDALKTYGDSIAKNAAGIAANAKAIGVNETAILQLGERVDKLEGYWYIDDDGNLHTTYSIVVDKGGAFGKGSGGGGDVPSGGGIDEAQLWDILGQSGTETIHSSHIPDLSGKYLSTSGGTIKGNIIARRYYFGDKNDNGYGYLKVDDNVNSTVYYVDNLGVYNTLIHSGNIGSQSVSSAKKLNPTNHGNHIIIDNSTWESVNVLTTSYASNLGDFTELNVPGGSANTASLKLLKNGNVLIGNLTTDAGYKLNVDGSLNATTIYQNDQTLDKYYLPLSGGTLKSSNVIVLRIDTTNSSQNAFLLSQNGVMKTQLGYAVSEGSFIYDYSTYTYLGIDANGAAYCGKSADVSSGYHHLLIHTGNIGSYNAGSATKLQDNTAYTAWGQTFFENGVPKSVSGANISLKQGVIFWHDDVSFYYIGCPVGSLGGILEYKSYGGHRFLGGNVLIGTTTDNGYKLAVNGTINATTIYQNGTAIGSLAFKNSLVASDIPNLSWSKITSGKPTTLSGYGITDAYTTTSIDSKLSGYLPLSGGTIESTSYYPLILNTTQTINNAIIYNSNKVNKAQIGWSTNVGTFLLNYSSNCYLGVKDDGTPYYMNSSDWVFHTLIHSGNIGSQSVTYATNATRLYASDEPYRYGDSHPFYLKMRYNVLGDKSWYLSVYPESPADVSVDRARKLVTSRTIWGQSFDGSANVFGQLSMEQSKIFWHSDNNNYYIGCPIVTSGAYLEYKAYSGHRFLGGNVLIGTTSDNGAKLQVNGGMTLAGSYNSDDTLTAANIVSRANIYIPYNTYGFSVSYSGRNGGVYMSCGESNGSALYNMFLQPFGGNVIIGSKGDNGAKLQVTGNLTITGGGAFGSDIRYKDIISYRQIDLETIVKAPLFSFRWTDREDKVEHLGTSAQYWLETQAKDAVNITNPKFFHLDYGALGVGIGISVAREVKGVKTEVQTLKEELSQVKKELKYYKELWQHSGQA